MSLPCIACKQTHSTPRAFLLTCCDCSTTWHHVCHTPPVSDQELISMIKAATRGEVDGSLSDWSCNNCKGVSDPELERQTSFASNPASRASVTEANHLSYAHTKQSSLTARKTATSEPQHTIYELSDDDDIEFTDVPLPSAAAAQNQPNESSKPVLSTYSKKTTHLPSSSSSYHSTGGSAETPRKDVPPASQFASKSSDSPEIEIIRSLPPVSATSTRAEAGARREHSSTLESEVEDMYGEEWVGRSQTSPDNAPVQSIIPTPSRGTSHHSALISSAEGDEIRPHLGQCPTHPENTVAHETRTDQENDGSIVWWVYTRERAMYESNSTGLTAHIRINKTGGRTKVQARHLKAVHQYPEKVGFTFVLKDWVVARTREVSEN